MKGPVSDLKRSYSDFPKYFPISVEWLYFLNLEASLTCHRKDCATHSSSMSLIDSVNVARATASCYNVGLNAFLIKQLVQY